LAIRPLPAAGKGNNTPASSRALADHRINRQPKRAPTEPAAQQYARRRKKKQRGANTWLINWPTRWPNR
jgi:hypothetical protein